MFEREYVKTLNAIKLVELEFYGAAAVRSFSVYELFTVIKALYLDI